MTPALRLVDCESQPEPHCATCYIGADKTKQDKIRPNKKHHKDKQNNNNNIKQQSQHKDYNTNKNTQLKEF